MLGHPLRSGLLSLLGTTAKPMRAYAAAYARLLLRSCSSSSWSDSLTLSPLELLFINRTFSYESICHAAYRDGSWAGRGRGPLSVLLTAVLAHELRGRDSERRGEFGYGGRIGSPFSRLDQAHGVGGDAGQLG